MVPRLELVHVQLIDSIDLIDLRVLVAVPRLIARPPQLAVVLDAAPLLLLLAVVLDAAPLLLLLAAGAAPLLLLLAVVLDAALLLPLLAVVLENPVTRQLMSTCRGLMLAPPLHVQLATTEAGTTDSRRSKADQDTGGSSSGGRTGGKGSNSSTSIRGGTRGNNGQYSSSSTIIAAAH